MRRVALMIGLLCLAGCSGRSGSSVELIVPKGFTGTVWLKTDPAGQDIPLVDGSYRIVVPADGELRVRSLAPLQQWHTFSARYDDGTPIPEAHGDGGVGPGTVAVRGGWGGVSYGGGQEHHYQTYVVGTAKPRAEMPADPDIPGAPK